MICGVSLGAMDQQFVDFCFTYYVYSLGSWDVQGGLSYTLHPRNLLTCQILYFWEGRASIVIILKHP